MVFFLPLRLGRLPGPFSCLTARTSSAALSDSGKDAPQRHAVRSRLPGQWAAESFPFKTRNETRSLPPAQRLGAGTTGSMAQMRKGRLGRGVESWAWANTSGARALGSDLCSTLCGRGRRTRAPGGVRWGKAWARLDGRCLSPPPLTCAAGPESRPPPRHHPAREGQQAHRRVPQGTLLQGLALPRRQAAVAPGDRAADAEDFGRPVGAAGRGGEAGSPHGGRQVGGSSAPGASGLGGTWVSLPSRGPVRREARVRGLRGRPTG